MPRRKSLLVKRGTYPRQLPQPAARPAPVMTSRRVCLSATAQPLPAARRLPPLGCAVRRSAAARWPLAADCLPPPLSPPPQPAAAVCRRSPPLNRTCNSCRSSIGPLHGSIGALIF